MAVSPKVHSFELLLQQQAGLLCDLEKQLKELRLTHKKMEMCLSECPVAKRKSGNKDKSDVVPSSSSCNLGDNVPVLTETTPVAKPARRQAVPRVKKTAATTVAEPAPVES